MIITAADVEQRHRRGERTLRVGASDMVTPSGRQRAIDLQMAIEELEVASALADPAVRAAAAGELAHGELDEFEALDVQFAPTIIAAGALAIGLAIGGDPTAAGGGPPAEAWESPPATIAPVTKPEASAAPPETTPAEAMAATSHADAPVEAARAEIDLAVNTPLPLPVAQVPPAPRSDPGGDAPHALFADAAAARAFAPRPAPPARSRLADQVQAPTSAAVEPPATGDPAPTRRPLIAPPSVELEPLDPAFMPGAPAPSDGRPRGAAWLGAGADRRYRTEPAGRPAGSVVRGDEVQAALAAGVPVIELAPGQYVSAAAAELAVRLGIALRRG